MRKTLLRGRFRSCAGPAQESRMWQDRGFAPMKKLGVPVIVAAAALQWAGITRADEFFSSRIEPLLKRRCYECQSHETGKMKGGLTLDSKSGWERGGDEGPAIVPGKPTESLLIKMVTWSDEDHQ